MSKSKKVIKMRLHYHKENKFMFCSRSYTDRKCQMQMNFCIYQDSVGAVPPHSDESEVLPHKSRQDIAVSQVAENRTGTWSPVT